MTRPDHDGKQAGGEPRFFIDHGVIHDRKTGKHVRTEPDGWEDGINACCDLLNEMHGRNEAIDDVMRMTLELDDQRLSEGRAVYARGFAAGIEAAAKHVANHSCVASCCDAQPSSGEAKALADCIRALPPPAQEREPKPHAGDGHDWTQSERNNYHCVHCGAYFPKQPRCPRCGV